MSCYEWEQGTLQVPASQWSKLKKALHQGVNAFLTKVLEEALHVHEVLSARPAKELRWDKLREYVWQQTSVRSSARVAPFVYEFLQQRYTTTPKGGIKLLKPLKKDLPFLASTFTSIEGTLAIDWGGSVSLNADKRQLHWHVGENNHAVESAWEHPYGKVLEDALSQVDWGRSGGGCFVGNDEYNRDDCSEGGGGNYVTKSFGSAAKSRISRR